MLWARLAILAVVLLIPPTAIILIYWKDVQFDPSLFVNGYIEFFGTLTSILFGFVLVQIYWETRMDRERARRARHLFLSHLREIGEISAETLGTHDEHATTPDEHDHIESRVRTGINRMQDASWSVTRFIEDWRTTSDEELTTQLTLFMRDVVPPIERLAKMKGVGPGDAQVHLLIAQVQSKVDQINISLGGQDNVSDSTR